MRLDKIKNTYYTYACKHKITQGMKTKAKTLKRNVLCRLTEDKSLSSKFIAQKSSWRKYK